MQMRKDQSSRYLNKYQNCQNQWETIYRNAVKRISSSSEDDPIVTSDEFDVPQVIDNFLEMERRKSQSPRVTEIDKQLENLDKEEVEDGEMDDSPPPLTPRQRGDELIRDAEKAKAKIFATPGKRVS